MVLLGVGISELNDVDLEDSLESLASALLALDDNDSLLGGLAGLDDDLSLGNDLLLLLDQSGETASVLDSDSFLLSENVSLSSLASGELDSESLDLGRASAGLNLVSELSSLDLLLSDTLGDLDLLSDVSDLVTNLSGFLSDSNLLNSENLGGLVATALSTVNSDDNRLLSSLANLDESLDSSDLELLLSESNLVNSNGGSVDSAGVSLDDLSPSLDLVSRASAWLSLDDDLTGLLADSDSLLDSLSVDSHSVDLVSGYDLSDLESVLRSLNLPTLDL